MLGQFRIWTHEGEAARARLAGQGAALDLRYGPHRENLLDLYLPHDLPHGVKNPPLWVFIHGGYWQASSKDQHAQYFDGMLAAGFAAANIDYPLAPETPLAGIVEHVRAALHFLVREQASLGVDASNMHVCGHSAGGHLAAFVAADPAAPPVRSSLPLSGIFDLEALRPIPMGPVLGLDSPVAATALSPMFMAKRTGVQTAFALGALESDEFKRQSAQLAGHWKAPAPLQLAGAQHFSLLDGLNGGPLLDLAKSIALQ
ncbi:MAG: alpha/beta hydrolase [Alphaproteobacteria bacterium]|nr:alpha/beta hydrolase [Alphaproteobacteria bacterium]